MIIPEEYSNVVLPGIAIIISIISLLYQYFGGILNIKKSVSDSEEKLGDKISNIEKGILKTISDIESRLTKSETKMELFWNAIGGAVNNLIKQPIHFRKDELMDKLQLQMVGNRNSISIEELQELDNILEDESVKLKQNKDPKVLAYVLAQAFIKQLLYIEEIVKPTISIVKKEISGEVLSTQM